MASEDALGKQFEYMTPSRLAERHWDPNMGTPEKLYQHDKGYFDKTLTPDIARNGVLNPVELKNDRIWEGHHRVVSALHLGIPLLKVKRV